MLLVIEFALVRRNLKNAQHSVEHLAVLSGDADDGFEITRVFLEFLYKGAHFDGFGACAEDEHDFFHISDCISYNTLYFLYMP